MHALLDKTTDRYLTLIGLNAPDKKDMTPSQTPAVTPLRRILVASVREYILYVFSDFKNVLFLHFYHKTLCSHGYAVVVCLSIGPSIKSCCSTKTAKHRIMEMSHDSTRTLVFWRQRYRQISNRDFPNNGTKCRWSRLKEVTFDK